MRSHRSLDPLSPVLKRRRGFRQNQPAELFQHLDQCLVDVQVANLVEFCVKEETHALGDRADELVDQGGFPNPGLPADQDQLRWPADRPQKSLQQRLGLLLPADHHLRRY